MVNFIQKILGIEQHEFILFLFTILSIIYVLFLYFGLEKYPKVKTFMKNKAKSDEYGLIYSFFMVTSLAGFMGEAAERITQVVLFLHSLTYSFLQ